MQAKQKKCTAGQDPGHNEEGDPLNEEVARSGYKASFLYFEKAVNEEYEEPMIRSMSSQEGVFSEKEKDNGDHKKEGEDFHERISILEKIISEADERLLAIQQYVTSTLPTEMATVFESLFQTKAQRFSLQAAALENQMSELWGEVRDINFKFVSTPRF